MPHDPRLHLVEHTPTDWGALGDIWQHFEQQAAISFFQSWAWVGCLAPERFDDPVLIEIRSDERQLALALFNRRRRRLLPDVLLLAESGHPAWDSVFIEHNDVLTIPGAAEARGLCLRAASAGRVLVLSGIGDAACSCSDSLPAVAMSRQTRAAPFVDAAAAGARYIDRLSPNTRYQLRRSARRYASSGELRVTRAGTEAERHQFLDALAGLHQVYWTGRGRPGAFANPHFVRFHHALIDRSPAVDLLRISAGDEVIGYLQNFAFRRRVAAYQSGFDYARAPTHAKPGMTCHHLAIEHYLAEGAEEYDFLAGEDRYKTSLATGSRDLHWVTLAPRRSLPGWIAHIKNLIRRYRSPGHHA